MSAAEQRTHPRDAILFDCQHALTRAKTSKTWPFVRIDWSVSQWEEVVKLIKAGIPVVYPELAKDPRLTAKPPKGSPRARVRVEI